MTETASVLTALVLVGLVGGAPMVAFAGGATSGPVEGQVAANETEVAPGERLSGVVGIERASVKAEVASRRFGTRLSAADSNDSRAAVVGDEVENLETRLADLRAERAALEAAHENGSISQGEYRARTAGLHAEQRALRQRINETERVAAGMPAERLRAHGVNVSRLRTMRSAARNITGPEMAAMARTVAGPPTDAGFGPRNAGLPDMGRNRTGGGPPAGPGGDGGPTATRSGDRDPTGAANETGSHRDGANRDGMAGDGPSRPGNRTDSTGGQ